MKLRGATIASEALIVGMLAYSAWAWARLPAGTQLTMRWSVFGRPDGATAKPVTLLLLPAIAVVLVGVFLGLAPRSEPRRAHLVASRRAFSVGIVATVGVLAAIHVVVISAALTNVTVRVALVPLVPAVIIATLGNYLGAVRSNFFFGVRTPWTLSSELSWERTNRLAGRLLVPLGVIVALMALADWALAGLVTLIVLLVASMAVAVVYSYRVWRDDPQRSDIGRQAGT
ncbi:MAG: SdpI family protein [Candidatus Dormibacteria bacterium]